MGDFDFDAWVKEVKLTRDTVRDLKAHKLNNHTSLMLLTPAELKRAGLALGQEVLVRDALNTLGNKNFMVHQDVNKGTATPTPSQPVLDATNQQPETTNTGETGDQGLDSLLAAGEQLDALLRNSPDVTGLVPSMSLPTPSRPTKPTADYDPRILLSAKPTQKKAEKIFAFLPEKVKERVLRSRKERMVLTQAADGTISVQNNEEERYSITIPEWGAANMRLMNYLLQHGDLSRADVEYYMAYTMQVFELASTYEWSSILLFDTRYRELQAEHGFLWGDMRLALQMQVLVPRSLQGKSRHNQPGKRQNGEQEDCKRWLSTGGTSCPFGSKCKYAHPRQDSTSMAPKND
jgi:hypothetical protein